jgi:hypothetical protein
MEELVPLTDLPELVQVEGDVSHHLHIEGALNQDQALAFLQFSSAHH